jgi:superfamily I DNA/RNA helicase
VTRVTSEAEEARCDEEWAALREARIAAIVDSPARKKLIVAGPGTGKTYAFGRLFRARGGRNLTLTFIRSLVADLAERLAGLSDVYTLHGYSLRLLHELAAGGLTTNFSYYPPLPWLLASDLEYLGTECSLGDVYAAFHQLDEERIAIFLRSADYYDAASHDDSVFRILTHLRRNPKDIPSWDLVVVDEVQDFNELEISFLNVLAERNSVVIAGDDDQALYGFKDASPRFIREMADSGEFESFQLPYCSRCPRAVVEAVRRVVGEAEERGLLAHRLAKPYECYWPAKRQSSQMYPRIVHAACTVERKDRSYMSRYVLGEIRRIGDADVRESYAEREPTALVVGPRHFALRVYEELAPQLPGVELRISEGAEPSLLDGYKLLRRSANSRLGWRIVTYVEPLGSLPDILEASVIRGRELADLLPVEYKRRHLDRVGLLNRYLNADQLSAEERDALRQVGVEYRQDAEAPVDAEAEPTLQISQPQRVDETVPKVIVTTLVGAKGLQAQHVLSSAS